MRVAVLARAALVASAARPALGFPVGGMRALALGTFPHQRASLTTNRFMSTTNTEMPPLKHIGREEMQQILDHVEQGDSDYVVIDVRNIEEIAYTGPLSPDVKTLPLPLIMQKNVFQLDDDEFEELCRFPKPEMDATLSFLVRRVFVPYMLLILQLKRVIPILSTTWVVPMNGSVHRNHVGIEL